MQEEIGNEIINIIKKFVSKPKEVDINIEEEEEDNQTTLKINVKVADEDIPTCIGRGGSTAEALRRLSVLIARSNGYENKIFFRVDAPPLPKNHYYED